MTKSSALAKANPKVAAATKTGTVSHVDPTTTPGLPTRPAPATRQFRRVLWGLGAVAVAGLLVLVWSWVPAGPVFSDPMAEWTPEGLERVGGYRQFDRGVYTGPAIAMQWFACDDTETFVTEAIGAAQAAGWQVIDGYVDDVGTWTAADKDVAGVPLELWVGTSFSPSAPSVVRASARGSCAVVVSGAGVRQDMTSDAPTAFERPVVIAE